MNRKSATFFSTIPEEKSAFAFLVSGSIANALGCIMNNILNGFGNPMSIVSNISLLFIVIVGTALYGLKKYRSCSFSIVCAASYIEFPFLVYFYGSSQLVYFLIPFLLIPVISFGWKKWLMFIMLNLTAAGSLLCHCYLNRGFAYDKPLLEFFTNMVSFGLSSLCVFLLVGYIIIKLSQAREGNNIADKIYTTLSSVMVLNFKDGTYRYLRKEEDEEDANERNLVSLMEKVVSTNFIHSNDLEYVSSLCNSNEVIDSLKKNGYFTSQPFRFLYYKYFTSDPFRFKYGKEYVWIEMNLVLNEYVSEADFSVILYIQHLANVDSDLHDACSLVYKNFDEIVKVNLTDDSYDLIKVLELDKNKSENSASTLVKKIASSFVDREDRKSFLDFTDFERLKRSFVKNDANQVLKFRMHTGSKTKWTSLEIVKSIDYCPESEFVVFFIRDIDDDYSSQLFKAKNLEYYCNYDVLTKLNNRNKYYALCEELRKKRQDCGMIYCDLNRLKYTNDNFGHEAGDRLIVSFANILIDHFGKENCYRLSGDEFAVILCNCKEEKFLNLWDKFIKDVEEENDYIAAAGYVYSPECSDLPALAKSAEKRMYSHKAKFYSVHSEFDRRK